MINQRRHCALLLVTVSAVLLVLYYTSDHVTSPLEKFASYARYILRYVSYARYIPSDAVAKEKFLADQAAVQSIPTETPGWVYNKTAADLFRRKIADASRLASGDFLVSQKTAKKVGLSTQHGKINVPEEVFKGLPEESPFTNRHFNTCSVVGNGGILKGSGCGKEIDSSEFVFRFNMAPMGGEYLKDIGKKTSLITINPSMIGYRYGNVKALMHDLSAYGDSYLFISAFINENDVKSAFKVQQALRGSIARNQVVLPYPLVIESIISFWKKQITVPRLTTGLLLASLATQVCEEVRLYGFWPFHSDRNNRRLTEHYYDNALPTEAHKVPVEFQQLQRLHNSGVLRLTTHACL